MPTLQFLPSNPETPLLCPPPKPASVYVPDWYKAIPAFEGGAPTAEGGQITNRTAKMCSPYSDAMMTGYIQETWCDLFIESDGEKVTKFEQSRGPLMVGARESVHIKIPPTVYSTEMVWKTPWQPITPKGYMTLWTPPINRPELPIVSLSGVVDSDVFYHSPNGNYPFFIRKGFTGIIPAGTPMYQLVPVKREAWDHKVLPWDEEEMLRRRGVINRFFINSYRRQFRKKKVYK